MNDTASAPPLRAARVGLHLFTGQGPLPDVLVELLQLADRAFAAGFDRISFGEHHANTPGYLPESWSVAAVALAAHAERSVGIFPFLAGLRPTTMAVEAIELAAALNPGRLSIAIAPGYAARDFEAAGVTLAESRRGCTRVLDALTNRARPVDCKILVAGAGPRAIRTAVDHGAGLLLPPLSTSDEADVIARYADARGTGGIVAQRWVATGDADVAMYAAMSSPYAPQPRRYRTATEFAAMLAETFATGITEVSVRVGGPEHAGAVGRLDIVELLEEGCGLWQEQNRALWT